MNLTPEQAEQLREFIANIFTDANMALNGDWDLSDPGFEIIRDNASQLYKELFGLDIEGSPEFEDYIKEKTLTVEDAIAALDSVLQQIRVKDLLALCIPEHEQRQIYDSYEAGFLTLPDLESVFIELAPQVLDEQDPSGFDPLFLSHLVDQKRVLMDMGEIWVLIDERE